MEIVMKDYNLDSFKEKDIYTFDEIISIIEDLESDLRIKEKELEDLNQKIEDNYKQLTNEELIGMNKNNFYEEI